MIFDHRKQFDKDFVSMTMKFLPDVKLSEEAQNQNFF